MLPYFYSSLPGPGNPPNLLVLSRRGVLGFPVDLLLPSMTPLWVFLVIIHLILPGSQFMCLQIPFVNSFLRSFKQPSVHWAPDMLGPEEAKDETLPHSLGEGNSHSCNSSRVLEGGSRGHWAGYVPKTSGWVGRHPRGSLGKTNKHSRSQSSPEGETRSWISHEVHTQVLTESFLKVQFLSDFQQ